MARTPKPSGANRTSRAAVVAGIRPSLSGESASAGLALFNEAKRLRDAARARDFALEMGSVAGAVEEQVATPSVIDGEIASFKREVARGLKSNEDLLDRIKARLETGRGSGEKDLQKLKEIQQKIQVWLNSISPEMRSREADYKVELDQIGTIQQGILSLIGKLEFERETAKRNVDVEEQLSAWLEKTFIGDKERAAAMTLPEFKPESTALVVTSDYKEASEAKDRERMLALRSEANKIATEAVVTKAEAQDKVRVGDLSHLLAGLSLEPLAPSLLKPRRISVAPKPIEAPVEIPAAVEGLSAEVVPDMDRAKTMLTQLEQAFALNNYADAHAQLDDIALTLELEAERWRFPTNNITPAELKAPRAQVAAARRRLRILERQLSTQSATDLVNQALAPAETVKPPVIERKIVEVPERLVPVKRKRPTPEALPETATPTPISFAEAATEPRSMRPALEVEPSGFFGTVSKTVSGAWNYIRTGWDRVKREEIWGELAPHELNRSIEPSRIEKGLQVTAGILGGLSSTFGAAFGFDAARWVTQNAASVPERAKLKGAILEAIKSRKQLHQIDRLSHNDFPVRREEFIQEHKHRRDMLVDMVNTSRRLTPEQKQVMLKTLETVTENFDEPSKTLGQVYEGEADMSITIAVQKAREDAYRILDTHLISKISGGKVLREGVNTGLAAGSVAAFFTGAGSVFAGMHFMRGPAYSIQAICERHKNSLAEHAPGERADRTNVLTDIQEGFTEWATKLIGKESRIKDRRQAIATLFRASGLGVTSMAAGGALAIEGMTDIDFDKILDQAFEQVKTYASEVYADVSLDAPEEIIAPETSSSLVLPEASAPDFKGEIPLGSRVERLIDEGIVTIGKEEGVTFPLKRVILENPDAYGYDANRWPDVDMFARVKSLELANAADLGRMWLTEKAVGKLNLFPEQTSGGEWTVAAVVDGKRVALDKLQELGYTIKGK